MRQYIVVHLDVHDIFLPDRWVWRRREREEEEEEEERKGPQLTVAMCDGHLFLP